MGIDPNEHKKTEQAIKLEQVEEEQSHLMTFGQLFEIWHKHNSETWSYAHARDIRERIEKHLLPQLGALPLDDIKPMDVIKVLKLIEQGGRVETTRRVKQYANRIFRFGIGFGHCERNPASDLSNDIFKKAIKKNYAHTTDPKVLTQILRAIDSGMIKIPAERMKKKRPHAVPIS